MSDAKERARFEKWAKSPPQEWIVSKYPDDSAWPGQYRSYVVQAAWEAWREALEGHK